MDKFVLVTQKLDGEARTDNPKPARQVYTHNSNGEVCTGN